MHFDIVIGNPPYQQDDNGYGASARPLYHFFIKRTKRLNPKHITMIIPARWFSCGKGLEKFRREMLNDKRVNVLQDFVRAADCFPDVEIKGGVCYFLWDREHNGKCKVATHCNGKVYESERTLWSPLTRSFVRYEVQVSVIEKVWQTEIVNSLSFASIVSPFSPFGLATNFFKPGRLRQGLPPVSETKIEGGFTIFGLSEKGRRTERYIPADYPLPNGKGMEYIDRWKVFVPKAGDDGGENRVIGRPFVGCPETLCTDTFLHVGDFGTALEAENCLSYMKTKFFRFLVGVVKLTHNAAQRAYRVVPLQDFTESWADEKLYRKYQLTAEEVAFIEGRITEMS